MTKETDNEAFVADWQRRNGLTADGWAGPASRAKLNEIHPLTSGGGKLTDPAQFFAVVKGHFGTLVTNQVAGFNAVTTALEGWPVSWVAYALATTWHETAATMQPIREMGGQAYFTRRYDVMGSNPNLAKRLGNTAPGDGARYAGRGYVQITGRDNYAKFGIASDPDQALKPDVAARILREGMETGIFTGKGLGDYLPGDYVNARRIINGTDKAELIADYARKFEQALTAGGWR